MIDIVAATNAKNVRTMPAKSAQLMQQRSRQEQHVADNAGWNQHQPHELGPVRLKIRDGVRWLPRNMMSQGFHATPPA